MGSDELHLILIAIGDCSVILLYKMTEQNFKKY